MVEWENEDKDDHPASPAEKQILIFQWILQNQDINVGFLSCGRDF